MKSCENCRYRKIDEKSLPCSACIDLGQDLSGWVGMKNADRIRGMTDEELATWLNCMQSNAYHCGEFGRLNAAYPFDNKAWLDWLKKEAAYKDGE